MAEPLNVVLVTLGTHGDVYPFVAIGQAMRERGHRVRLIANPYYGALITEAGLELVPAGTEDELRQSNANPDLWNARRSLKLVMRLSAQQLRPVYQAVLRCHQPGKTVVVHNTIAMGARIAQEQLRIPTITTHLAPALFHGLESRPAIPGFPIPNWAPRIIWRAVYKLFGLWVAKQLGGPIQSVRSEAGLPLDQAWVAESPDGILAMFPPWFAPKRNDWPEQTRQTGFAMFEERSTKPLDPALVEFLDAGDPPIAFTPGSGMWRGHRFFAEAVKVCQQLGQRGLLISRHAEHVPRQLPPTVKHVTYSPFGQLLRRCAAVVHHGGIGTLAQAMAAGIPQLITPFAHDQPDNARRLLALGVGQSISGTRFRARPAAKLLKKILESEEVKKACRAAAEHFPAPDVLADTCSFIEEVASKPTKAVRGPMPVSYVPMS